MVEPSPNSGPLVEDDIVEDGVTVVPMSAWKMLPLGPPGVGTSANSREEALERRRRRLAEAAGLDPGRKSQAELPLDFAYWRADRWQVEVRWKPHVARELCPGNNPWTAHQLFLDCRTECVARNACALLRKQFPGKSYHYRPVRWTDAKGNRFPTTL